MALAGFNPVIDTGQRPPCIVLELRIGVSAVRIWARSSQCIMITESISAACVPWQHFAQHAFHEAKILSLVEQFQCRRSQPYVCVGMTPEYAHARSLADLLWMGLSHSLTAS